MKNLLRHKSREFDLTLEKYRQAQIYKELHNFLKKEENFIDIK
jgi:hypothetical protein